MSTFDLVRQVGEHGAQAVGGLDHAAYVGDGGVALDPHGDDHALPADGDVAGHAQLPAGVVVAGDVDLDVADRDAQARAPQPVSHRQAAADAGAHQLAGVGGAAGPTLLGPEVGDQHAVGVADLADRFA